MKQRLIAQWCGICMMFLVAACVPMSNAPTPVRPPAHPSPLPPTPTPSPPTPADWRDVPETQGGWTYRNGEAASIAAFGPAGAEPEFLLRCDRSLRRLNLSRLGAAAGPMTIKTSYAERSWPAGIVGARAEIVFSAADPFLDQLAFSRGRFSVTMAGVPTLVLPAWAEPARVIEDCRS